jgi:hypothetical protein
MHSLKGIMTETNERAEEAEDSPLRSRKLSSLLSQEQMKGHQKVVLNRDSSKNRRTSPVDILGSPEGDPKAMNEVRSGMLLTHREGREA